MSEYSDTAKRFSELRASRRDRLKALNERMDKHETDSDETFRKYEGSMEMMENGMKEMDKEAEEMRNEFEEKDDGKGGKTDSTVAAFPKTGEQAKTA